MLRMTRRVALSLLLATIATGAWTQVDEGPRITFDFRDADIKAVMQAFGRQTGVQYVFDQDITKTVTVSLRGQPIEAALKVVLSSANLTSVYDEATGVYHIKAKPKRTTETRPRTGRGGLLQASVHQPVRTRSMPAAPGMAGASDHEEQEELLRLIRVRFSDALLFSDGVGIGSAMGGAMSGLGGGYGGGGYGGGGYGGGGYGGGGYGGGGYGRDGYGSNRRSSRNGYDDGRDSRHDDSRGGDYGYDGY